MKSKEPQGSSERSKMKKALFVLMAVMFVASSAFADGSTSQNSTGKEINQSIGGFFQKLNPMPFFKEQEKKYNERKAASGK